MKKCPKNHEKHQTILKNQPIWMPKGHSMKEFELKQQFFEHDELPGDNLGTQKGAPRVYDPHWPEIEPSNFWGRGLP